MSRSRATRRTLLTALVAALGFGIGLPGAAPAAKKSTRATVKDDLWATVNICDTKEHPNTIGIRGSMPGSGKAKERMFMRFQLQFFDQQAEQWSDNGDSGMSSFISVGSAAKRKARETGRNFTVRPPRTGAFYLRGEVTFEWRRGKKVTRRLRRTTTSKHPGTAGADPSRFSANKCILRAE